MSDTVKVSKSKLEALSSAIRQHSGDDVLTLVKMKDKIGMYKTTYAINDFVGLRTRDVRGCSEPSASKELKTGPTYSAYEPPHYSKYKITDIATNSEGTWYKLTVLKTWVHSSHVYDML